MMSSTPRSNASSLVRRSPRRVSAIAGIGPPAAPRADPLHHAGAVDALEVHVEQDQVRPPPAQDDQRLGRADGLAGLEDAVVERQLDQLGDHRLVEHQQHPRRDARGRLRGRWTGGRCG